MSVRDTPENRAGCVCPTCPTYDACMLKAGQRLFCARGCSGCDPRQVECICGTCPVWVRDSLTGFYYCGARE